MKEKVLRPFLKWTGGKRQLLPERAVIADINQELIIAYHAVRDDPDELIKLLTIHREKNYEEYYYIKNWSNT